MRSKIKQIWFSAVKLFSIHLLLFPLLLSSTALANGDLSVVVKGNNGLSCNLKLTYYDGKNHSTTTYNYTSRANWQYNYDTADLDHLNDNDSRLTLWISNPNECENAGGIEIDQLLFQDSSRQDVEYFKKSSTPGSCFDNYVYGNQGHWGAPDKWDGYGLLRRGTSRQGNDYEGVYSVEFQTSAGSHNTIYTKDCSKWNSWAGQDTDEGRSAPFKFKSGAFPNSYLDVDSDDTYLSSGGETWWISKTSSGVCPLSGDFVYITKNKYDGNYLRASDADPTLNANGNGANRSIFKYQNSTSWGEGNTRCMQDGDQVRFIASNGSYVKTYSETDIRANGEKYDTGSQFYAVNSPNGDDDDYVPDVDYTVWGVNSNYDLYQLNSTGTSWNQDNNSRNYYQVSVGTGGEVWAIGESDNGNVNKVFRKDGNSWVEPEDSPAQFMASLSVGSRNHIWGRGAGSASNYVYQWTGSSWDRLSSSRSWVSVGDDGELWSVKSSSYRVGRWNGSWTGGVWDDPAATITYMKHVSVGSADHIWGIDEEDRIYRFNGTSWEEPTPNSRLKQISVSSKGHVWGVNAEDKIYRFNGTSWEQPTPNSRLKFVSVASLEE